MARTNKPRARAARTNKAGRELLDAVREAHRAVTTGDFSGITIRQVEIPGPAEYGPTQVKTLRRRLGVSHRVFAELVGISRELATQWEYGTRKPSRLACRLLDRITADPDGYLASLMKRKAG